MQIIKEAEKISCKLFTIKELSERLAISEHTIRKWVSLDVIPYTKIGRTVRFIPEHIKEWEERKSLGKVKVDLI